MMDTAQAETNHKSMRPREVTTPPVDVYETDEGYVLVADVPGVNREDLSISFARSELVIEADAANAHRFYRRVFTLPEGIDGANIGAELKNGVLRVRLPKAAEVRPRRIDVAVG